MKEINYSLKFHWIIAAIAAIITILIFEFGPSSDIVILGSPVVVSSVLTLIGLSLFSREITLGILEKFNILILFTPFIATPSLLFTFLHQSQYGSLILILGIFNIILVTVLQAIEIFFFTFFLKKVLHKIRAGM